MGEQTFCSPISFYGIPMSYKAIDAVLLPDERMTDFTIAANSELVQKSGSEIVFNKKDCLPHISLAMGCIKEEDISEIGKMLRQLVAITPKSVKPVSIQKTRNSSGKIVSVIQIERTNELQKFHENISEVIRKYLTFDISEDMVAGKHASETTLEWIRNYPVKSGYANYSPHITIGYGDLADRPLPKEFRISKLAICHLGNHCTCRENLWSAEI